GAAGPAGAGPRLRARGPADRRLSRVSRAPGPGPRAGRGGGGGRADGGTTPVAGAAADVYARSMSAAEALLFRDLAYVFAAALVGGILAHAAPQPLILGYVAGGVIIGPFTPGPTVSDVHTF